MWKDEYGDFKYLKTSVRYLQISCPPKGNPELIRDLKTGGFVDKERKVKSHTQK